MKRRKWKVAGICFEHMHMGDNLRMARAHPAVEIVGICDEEPARMEAAIAELGLARECVFTDWRRCLERSKPDLVLLCPAAASHGTWVERVAPFDVHILIEKPLAASLAEADRMIAAMPAGKVLVISWPLAWYPPHRTSQRLIGEGLIGEVLEVHFYDGNRGPLWHRAGKEATAREWVEREKPRSWFYQRARGGGSLLDYLGYGATLGTWFQGGRVPLDVCSCWHVPAGLEVDEHSITVARYAHGLSKFETRWGTFSDPWTHQPQPRCGFVIVGSEGTIASRDFTAQVRVQTRAHPEGFEVAVDRLEPPNTDSLSYVIDCLENERCIEGPLSIGMSRIGQRIVDTAFRSAEEGRTLALLGEETP